MVCGFRLVDELDSEASPQTGLRGAKDRSLEKNSSPQRKIERNLLSFVGVVSKEKVDSLWRSFCFVCYVLN